MAEYCPKCAKKLGLEPEEKPLLCEGCGRYFYKVSFWQRIKNLLLINKSKHK